MMAAASKRDGTQVEHFLVEPDTFYLGIKSLNVKSVASAKGAKDRVVPVAARHICREIPAEVCRSGGRIDPARSAMNYSLLPGLMTEAAITARALAVMAQNGIEWKQKRRDQIMGVELVFSLPPDFKHDSRAFFVECLRWTERHFPQPAQIIAAIVHVDEGGGKAGHLQAGHLHVLLVPIVAHGRMDGHALVGYQGLYAERVNSFHAEVAHRFGLRKPRRKPKLTSAQRHELADRIIGQMLAEGWIASPASVKAMRTMLARDPLPMAQSMGLAPHDAAIEPPTAYAVADAVLPDGATALLCNAVHADDAIRETDSNHAGASERALPASLAASGMRSGARPRPKKWIETMTRVMPREKPAWTARSSPSVSTSGRPDRIRTIDAEASPPRIGPSAGAGMPVPIPQLSGRAQVLLGLRAAGHMHR